MFIHGKTKTTREAPLSLTEDQEQCILASPAAATKLTLAQIQQLRKGAISYITEISNNKG